MKTFASASFFRTFDLLLAKTNPSMKLSRWNYDGVDWGRERHCFGGGTHGFAVEVVTITRSGRQGWTLMVVKEFWWAGNQGKDIRGTHWAHLMSGRRTDALEWMREQERALEHTSERYAEAGTMPRR